MSSATDQAWSSTSSRRKAIACSSPSSNRLDLEQFHFDGAAGLGPLAFVLGPPLVFGRPESQSPSCERPVPTVSANLESRHQEQRTSRTTSSTTTRTRKLR